MKSEFHLPQAEQLVEIRIILPNVFRIESSGLTDSVFNSVYEMMMAKTRARLYRMPPFDARLQAERVRLCVSRAV